MRLLPPAKCCVDSPTAASPPSYEYRNAPASGRQLGFIIDDIEPSVAAAGDRVNLYGYLSMAVAAIQVQDKQIEALRQQVSELRERLEGPGANACTP